MTPQVIDPGDPPPLRVIQTGDIDIFSDVHWIQPGRFSDVLYGFSHSFAENVALKRLRNQDDGKCSERDLRLFNEEASIWHTLEHPHVLPLRGVYLCQSGFTYLVSPYMDNGDLMNYLKSNPAADRRPLLTDIASAIAYLHSLSIIHGDIKARNILVSTSGSAQLCDFGLSKHSSWTTSEGRKGAGTIRWQSPELLFDEPKSFKSDVYAFGITIFEVLSGEIPFGSSSDGAIVYGVVLRNARPPCLPKFDESGRSYADVWAVARECWHRVAGSRPEMREVWRKLEMQVIREKTVHAMVLADEDDVLATPSGPGPPLARVSTTPEVISADDDEVEETNELSARRHTIDAPLNLTPNPLEGEEEEEEEPEFLFTPPDSPLLGATAGPVIGGGLLPLDSANFALEEQEQDVEEQGEEQGIGRVPMMATMDKVAEDRLGREQLQQQLGGGNPRQGYGGDNRRSDDSSSGVGGSDDANRGFAYYDSLISSFGSLGKGELGKTITLDHHQPHEEEQQQKTTMITKSIPPFISPKSSIDWANWGGCEESDNRSSSGSTRTGTTRKRTTNYLF